MSVAPVRVSVLADIELGNTRYAGGGIWMVTVQIEFATGYCTQTIAVKSHEPLTRQEMLDMVVRQLTTK